MAFRFHRASLRTSPSGFEGRGEEVWGAAFQALRTGLTALREEENDGKK